MDGDHNSGVGPGSGCNRDHRGNWDDEDDPSACYGAENNQFETQSPIKISQSQQSTTNFSLSD